MGCCGNKTVKSTPRAAAKVLSADCAVGFQMATYTGPTGYVVTKNGNAYGTQATGSKICVLVADLNDPLFK